MASPLTRAIPGTAAALLRLAWRRSNNKAPPDHAVDSTPTSSPYSCKCRRWARKQGRCRRQPETHRTSRDWYKTECSRRSPPRSEEHTSELQSLTNLVCRLLLEKKKRQHHRAQQQL